MEIVDETGRVVASEVARNAIEMLELPDRELQVLGARARERVLARYDIGTSSGNMKKSMNV